jgi:ATP-dependent DNA helicase RecQ
LQREVAELLHQRDKLRFLPCRSARRLKDKKQASWTTGETRVIVSTNAFGMGIDKAEVRFVFTGIFRIQLKTIFRKAAGQDGIISLLLLFCYILLPIKKRT